MMWSSSRILLQRRSRAGLPIIPTAPICLWVIPTICSLPWISRTGCRRCIPSGTVFHAFLGERLSDWETAAKLVRTVAENYRLPYYTLSPTYSICKDHGYLTGEQFECPICHKKTEVYSRITGYYRPVQNWNDGKVQEFKTEKNLSDERTADRAACFV